MIKKNNEMTSLELFFFTQNELKRVCVLSFIVITLFIENLFFKIQNTVYLKYVSKNDNDGLKIFTKCPEVAP